MRRVGQLGHEQGGSARGKRQAKADHESVLQMKMQQIAIMYVYLAPINILTD